MNHQAAIDDVSEVGKLPGIRVGYFLHLGEKGVQRKREEIGLDWVFGRFYLRLSFRLSMYDTDAVYPAPKLPR